MEQRADAGIQPLHFKLRQFYVLLRRRNFSAGALAIGVDAIKYNLCALKPRLRRAPVEIQGAQRLGQRHLGAFQFKFGGSEFAFQRVDFVFGNDIALLHQVVALEKDRADAAIPAKVEGFLHFRRDAS